MPIVSVIMPNYNHAAYLKQRIDSILQQTFTDFELILLDDCSTDSSRSVLQGYADNPHVTHILYNDRNTGSPFMQWTKGLELAQGTYVWIAESDDYAHPDFLKQTVSALDAHPDVAIAYTGSQMIDAQGAPMAMDWDKFPPHVAEQTYYKSRDFLLYKMLWKSSVYNAGMVLFRRSCYDKADKGFRSFRYCGDWYFWCEVCRQGDVISINRKLNYFRQHTQKVSPGAEREGLYFIEGGRVMERTMQYLHLSAYQRLIVVGRTLKRLHKLTKHNPLLHQRILDTGLFFTHGGRWTVILYEVDKYLHFSGLWR